MYRYDRAEVEMVTRVVESGSWFRYYGRDNHCQAVKQLEEKLAAYTGAKHVLATSSGTGALVSSFAALGVGAGDEVIVPAYTFIATAAAAIAAGAVPVIAEIDETLTLDVEDVEKKISPRTKAIVPVHMRGRPGNMDAILALAKKHGLKVLEDAAQAVGASYKGRTLGTLGDMGIYSLQWHKIITSGEGGCVLTNDKTLYERAAICHDDAHCFRKIDEEGGAPSFPGVNYRMSEIAGAVGLAQIEKLPGILADLRKNKKAVLDRLGDLGSDYRVAPDWDAEGDAGTDLVIQARDAKAADAFKERSGCGCILNTQSTDWHVYYHWDYILEKRSANGSGFPWKFGDWESPVEYSKDMCPRTLDILGRTFSFGLHPDMDEEKINAVVHRIQQGAGIGAGATA